MFLLIPLFWIALIVFLVVFFAVRRRRHGWYGPGRPGHPGYPGHPGFISAAASAERTLAERFARGDIDEKEYRARLEVLRADRPEF